MTDRRIGFSVTAEQYKAFQQYCREISKENPTGNSVTMADVLRGFVNACVPAQAHIPTKNNQWAMPPTTVQFLRATVFTADEPLYCICGHIVELHNTLPSDNGKYRIGGKHICNAPQCACEWFTSKPQPDFYGIVDKANLEPELFDEFRRERDGLTK